VGSASCARQSPRRGTRSRKSTEGHVGVINLRELQDLKENPHAFEDVLANRMADYRQAEGKSAKVF